MLVPLYDKPRMKKFLLLLLVFVLILLVYQYIRPLPGVSGVAALVAPKVDPAPDLPWPVYGQGALAAQGYGLLQTHGEQKAVPMASIAKVVTALSVLKQKPLAAGQQGPTITLTSADVAIYNSYYSQGGSVVKVETGEKISEYQALQALLIPSANNIADTLAVWAFGSLESYQTYANKMLKDMGLSLTKVVDASGFSAGSVSTAQDLAKLGLVSLDNQLLTSIVGQETADVPVAGTISNVNWLLGSDGVIGIKTGNTTEAGGCFLFAAKRSISSQNITLAGALMQAPDLNTAVKDARSLIKASDSGFEFIKVVAKGQAIGTYRTPWGTTEDAVAGQDLNILAWRGAKFSSNVELDKLKPNVNAGAQVGSVSIAGGLQTTSIPVVLKGDLSAPAWTWRIFR